MKEKKDQEITRIEKERSEFKSLLLENQNYFGTFPETDLKSVSLLKNNVKYEEIRCVGFDIEENLLEAIVDVKLPYGYKGDLCSNGSYEYVRFFVDWDGDGFFNDPEDDVGIARVNVHDIPNKEYICVDHPKPLSYSVRLRIDPPKNFCFQNNLLKIKAILSWDLPPTPANPNFIPPWGNVVERWIQIKPKSLKVFQLAEAIDFDKLELKKSMLDLDVPISNYKKLTFSELKEIYHEQDVPEHRFNFKALSPFVKKILADPGSFAEYKKEPKFQDILGSLEALIYADPSKKYEELNCLGLNYNFDQLVASFTVKKPSGYSGNLCTDGSTEYIAFWANLYDKIEQQCIWRYLGHAKVNVHDIKNIPPDGIQYAVHLPVDFSKYKDYCTKPVILKVRAILSWEEKPPENNPYFDPKWGNKMDRIIQLKPAAPSEGQTLPYIWSAGNMAVESISGNIFTIEHSSIGSGYANGPAIEHGFSAEESPFGGIVAISGNITNPPNDPTETAKLRYKVQYRKWGGGSWTDIITKFRIWIRNNGIPSGYIDQIHDGGYFKYQKDLIGPNTVEVQSDIVAIWNTKALEDGLYDIRILVEDSSAPFSPGIPLGHRSSEYIKIRLDNTRPKAEISLDAGPCTDFVVGQKFKGKFTATDQHIWRYKLSVKPLSVLNKPTVSPTQAFYPTALPAPGLIDEVFEVETTSNTSPCGYVIELDVRDRAIVNNHFPGNRAYDDVGLCLRKKETAH